MIISKEQHIRFLEDELRAETESFQQKLATDATYLLLEKEELYLAQLLKFEDGEMILKFSNNSGIPRNGDYLYCFTVPLELRNYRNWGKLTYGDLIKRKGSYSEVICIWQTASNDNKYCLVGFRGIDKEFAEINKNAIGMILLLGPNKPPFEYLGNLLNIVKHCSGKVEKMLLQDYSGISKAPFLLDSNPDQASFIINQLELQDNLILQGPPGTGKTFLIADICKLLLNENKSVLVTALTNRALMELAEKDHLKPFLSEGRIFKTKVSVDENRELPELVNTKTVSPIPGSLILSTFYISSGEASQIGGTPPFDYVILDESSQALLAMLAGSQQLGEKCLWIGDLKQMPAVVSLNEDRIEDNKQYPLLIEGLRSLSSTLIPNYQLSITRRLTDRAAHYTGLFYNNTLKAFEGGLYKFINIAEDIKPYFHHAGGPTLLTARLPSSLQPTLAIQMATKIVAHLIFDNPKVGDNELKVAVLTHYTKTTKALQKAMYQTIGARKNLQIETVASVQGMTTDVVVYVIPKSGYAFSLDPKVFNVATSRARLYTIIIADDRILQYPLMDNDVYRYLSLLEKEFAFRFGVYSLGDESQDQLRLCPSHNTRDNIKQLYPGFENIIDLLMDNQIPIDEEGNVALTDEDDVVIAEARMLFMDKKIAIDPLDKESENVFITKGFKIVRSEEFDINAFN
jgi:hypothetical protein